MNVDKKTVSCTPQTHIVLPPIAKEGSIYVIPQYAEVLLTCCIPEGMLATSTALDECLQKAYRDLLPEEYKTQGASYATQRESYAKLPMQKFAPKIMQLRVNKSFPAWRVISERGHLIDMPVLQQTRELQREILEQEGFTIVEKGNNQMAVENYKEHLFDFDNLQITVRTCQSCQF